ncbi:HNH endonuclease [Streptomyces sp. P6-2-1]|uniref:HNH endonuclease n=1 Tax=unclassified Streptomyces TaxID=2593676 RepID=UPI003D35D7DE
MVSEVVGASAGERRAQDVAAARALSKTEGAEIAEALAKARRAAAEYLAVLEQAEASQVDHDSWLESAAQLGRWSAELREHLGEVRKRTGIGSGREAILRYLRRHVGVPVPGHALAGVSGISEWARRVRELRVEEGWPIESGVGRRDLLHDHYRLTADEPDRDGAAAWRVAQEARTLKRSDGKGASAREKLLFYLKEITPLVATKEQLAHVANIQEWPRRLRELEEEGWQIHSNVDDPSLAPGSYRLHTLTKRPPRVREAIKLRYRILDRDERVCRDCGSGPAQGAKLQIHHILPVHKGGNNEESNLVTLCSQCHGGRHSLMAGAAKDELLHPEYEADLAPE